MDIFNKYKECKINNIQVYCEYIENPKIGNKLIINEIPNYGKTIQFFGDNEFQGIFYGAIEFSRRDEIEEILDLKESLTLELPYGEKYKIFIQDNNSSCYYQNSIGYYKLKFQFFTSIISSEEYLPTTFENINNIIEELQEAKETKLKDFFITTVLTIQKIKIYTQNIIAEIENILNYGQLVITSINSITEEIQAIKNTIDRLLAYPDELASSIDNLIKNISDVFVDNETNRGAMYSLVMNLTIDNENETNNLLSSFIISSAVQNYTSILNLSDIIYQYEIDKYLKEIENLKNKIQQMKDDELIYYNENILNNLINFLNEKAEFTKKLIEYKVPVNTSEHLISYQLYGNTNEININNLRQWNNFDDWNFIKKDSVIKFYI